MKIAIIGASGSIGRVLVQQLKKLGHEVFPVSRSVKDGWRKLGPDCLEGVDAVVNLAGDRIDKSWNDSNKALFWESRVGLAQSIRLWIDSMDEPPKVWLNASAIGIYGDGGDALLHEGSPVGEGYLAELCEEWEDAAAVNGVRVIHTRIGVVLGEGAMAWQRMAKVFSLGFGGRLGSGKQWFPWVHMEDVVGGMIHVLESDSFHGAVNLVAPQSLRNEDFTKQVAGAYGKTALFHVPKAALKLALGGFATALLASHRVEPRRLREVGYTFRYKSLKEALENLI